MNGSGRSAVMNMKTDSAGVLKQLGVQHPAVSGPTNLCVLSSCLKKGTRAKGAVPSDIPGFASTPSS